jgi:hypothetical protein
VAPSRDEAVARLLAVAGLLALFVRLQIADITTINHTLTISGIWEANTLIASAQAKLGAAWWLPKVV